jgi:GH24 family phage-related lysozyme (muramidase)
MNLLDIFRSKNDPNTVPRVDPPKAEKPKFKYSDTQGRLLINESGMELVKHFESFFPAAYKDPVGVVTIGWGTIIYPDGKKVGINDKCTEEEATAYLMHDLWEDGAKPVRAFTDDKVEAELNEDQFSALVSLAYNRGGGRYRDFIAPHVNRRDFPNATLAMLSLNWAIKNGNRSYLLGLDRRRWAEKMLFEGKDWTPFKSIEWFKAFKNRGYRDE